MARRGWDADWQLVERAKRFECDDAVFEFAARARSALPYWLQRVKEMEDTLHLAYRALTDGLDGIPSEILRQSGGSKLRAEAKRKIREVLEDVVD